MSEDYSELIVDVDDTNGTKFVYRMCPFCGESIKDIASEPLSGYPMHINSKTPKHIKNEYWRKLEDERVENKSKIDRIK